MFALCIFLLLCNLSAAYQRVRSDFLLVKVQTRLHALFPFQKPTSKPIKSKAISEEAKQAYNLWLDSNRSMKETAPNFLTLEKCADKFSALASVVGDPQSALAIVSADSTILAYGKERVGESFAAWEAKLGSREETIKLVTRNPPVLSIGPLFVKAATSGDIAQTHFWSYVAVAFRPLSSTLAKLVSNVVK